MPVSNVYGSPDDAILSPSQGVGMLKAVPYPSPYFDLSQTYFPASIKELFQYCIFFYNTHCIIPAVVNKLASYPITDLVFTTNDDELKKKWKRVFIDELNIPFELYQIGIDLGVFGNSFVGIYFPFKRYLECLLCNSINPFNAVEDKKVKGRKIGITGRCPSCDRYSHFEIHDKYIKNVKKIRLIRYDPMLIDVIADPLSGEKVYLYEVPSTYKDAIRQGKDMDLLERAPKIVLDAVREDKKIRLSNKNMYHMKRPSISGQGSAWGFPLMMHALKSLYYLQVLKMAQEAIAIQHVIPLWVLYPQAGNGGSSLPPAQAIGLGKWKTQLEGELTKWRKDRNHIPILNFPVGFEQIGGEGRGLLLGPEVQQEMQQVIASMSVPQEFVFGGLTWTGSSITLRMLENTFQGTRDGMQRFIRFLVSAFSKYLGYEQIDIYMSELKMADDIQRQQICMNLEATGKISTSRLLSEFGYDYKEEEKLKKEEFGIKLSGSIRDMILQARAQGEAGLVSADYQMRAQKEQMEEQMAMQQAQATTMGGQPGQPGTGASGQPGGQVDPQTGLPIDPQTGYLIDQQNGIAIDPKTGQQFDLQTGQPIDGGQGEMQGQNQTMQATSLDPAQAGAAQGNTSLQIPPQLMAAQPNMEEQKQQQQEAMAQQGIGAGQMPPTLKAMVTRYATALLFTDQVQQQNILGQMATETPTLANLVKSRMMELTTMQGAIPQPEPPDSENLPVQLKPTTGVRT